MKNKITLLNMISGLLLQIAVIISGFIVPKLILIYFGSNVNGLVSSINQFLSYISLVEGGITGVVMAKLYKPLVDNDTASLSAVITTAKKFYIKIGLVFIAYTLVLAVIYPLLFAKKYSFVYTASLVVILSIVLVIQYLFSITLKTLLSADKKLYIVNFSQAFIVVLNIVLALVSLKVFPSIHIMKLITGLLFVIQPIIYGRHVKKNYSIDWSSKTDDNLIKDRWNGFAINIAFFVHSSTDVIILTIFSTLEMVSVYSVYLLVTNGVKSLLNAVFSGINPTIGKAYAGGDSTELNEKLDIYEYIVFLLVCFLFSATLLLITPFVLLYTKGINDANYYQPIFAAVLVASEAAYLLKMPHLCIAYVADKFKEITLPAYIEAGINVVISIVLVPKLGIVGVAIGTLVAMIYRMISQVRFTTRIVKGRYQWIYYKKLLLFVITSVVGILICYFAMPIGSITVSSWIIRAIEYCVVLATLYLLLSIIFFKKELRYFVDYIRK